MSENKISTTFVDELIKLLNCIGTLKWLHAFFFICLFTSMLLLLIGPPIFTSILGDITYKKESLITKQIELATIQKEYMGIASDTASRLCNYKSIDDTANCTSKVMKVQLEILDKTEEQK